MYLTKIYTNMTMVCILRRKNDSLKTTYKESSRLCVIIIDEMISSMCFHNKYLKHKASTHPFAFDQRLLTGG